jgi:branched-chain amino acid transport system substrate-binding protein
LNTQIAIKDSEIQSLRSLIDSLKNTITSLNLEIANKDSQISSLNQQINSLRQTNVALYNSIQTLNATISLKESEITQLKSEITNLTSRIYELEKIKTNLTGQTVQIGVIAPTEEALELWRGILLLAKEDINNYCMKLGYGVKFDFVPVHAYGQEAIHLEKVQSFKAMGINLLIGGAWSSQAMAALSYINENNMLLFSPSSTSPLLAIKGDNLYRMCPDDTVQAWAIAEMLRSWGIKAVIVMQRGDAWADGIYNILERELPARGVLIVDRVRYAAEATEFSRYLATMEDRAKSAVAQYGKDAVAVEVLSFWEIVTQAKDYPTIYSLFWFGSDGTAMTQRLIDDAPTQANKLKIFSTLAAPGESPRYKALYDRYYALTKMPLGIYTANIYDIAWILASAVLQAQSTDPKILIPLIHTIAYNHFGASGWTRLNEAGDRATGDYEIWGYGDPDRDGKVDNVKYGFFDGTTGKVTWYTDILAKEGIKVPALGG